jgi:hypothetical protein
MIPKRLFWLAVGYGAGIGSSVYATRKLKAAAARMSPEGVTSRVSASVTGTVREVKAAVAEGRDAMHAREDELRGTGA